MRMLAGLLLLSMLAVGTWAAQTASPQTHAAPQSAPAIRSETSPCDQDWQEMAQRHREEAQDLAKETSSLQALLVMMRNDAGIVQDSLVRDALRVNADMWQSLIGTLQKQTASLQSLAEQEDMKRQNCPASTRPRTSKR